MSGFEPAPAVEGPPVCPRHPDRISYVRCQRCGRPVCPECQRPAAVGVQCVDCVAEAAGRTRQARTAFGGKIRAGRPVVTITIIALCALSFVLQQVNPTWVRELAFYPILGEIQPYRFLTAAFLHASVVHILFNMWALWIVGPFLEAQLGRARYVALYVLSALGGSVGVLLFASPTTVAWITPVVGASGAVFGLFGAVLVVLSRTGSNTRSFLIVIALNLAIGFVVQGVSWQGHVGGLLTGAVLGLVYAHAPAARRREVGILATVLVGVLLVGLALAKYASLGQLMYVSRG